MENISDKLEQIVEDFSSAVSNLEQLKRFEDTMKDLQSLTSLDKPQYNLPQVDTLGRTTYLSLNRQ